MAIQFTAPNQKRVSIHKEKCDKQHLYAVINLEALEAAARDLPKNSFKLWVYLAKNNDGFELAMGNKAVFESFGIKKDAYDDAVEDLREKGYLVQVKGNIYEFHEVPVEKVEEVKPVKVITNTAADLF